MSEISRVLPAAQFDALFGRIVSILEEARGNVVRAVNSNMVLAYWLIGREIVEELQLGMGRAKYGEKVIEDLSTRLTERYGPGFSATNLKYFRLFYQAYSERIAPIRHPAGDESSEAALLHPVERELVNLHTISTEVSAAIPDFFPPCPSSRPAIYAY